MSAIMRNKGWILKRFLSVNDLYCKKTLLVQNLNVWKLGDLRIACKIIKKKKKHNVNISKRNNRNDIHKHFV